MAILAFTGWTFLFLAGFGFRRERERLFDAIADRDADLIRLHRVIDGKDADLAQAALNVDAMTRRRDRKGRFVQ